MRKEKKQTKREVESKRNWTEIASFSLTAFSVFIGTWAFVKSWNNEHDLAEANYKLAAVEHRPMIRFYNPKLVGLDLMLDTAVHSKPPLQNDTMDIKSKLQPRIKLHYKNIGNSNAKILGYILTDTITNEPVLKTFVRKRANNRQTMGDSIISNHSYHELAVLDSSDITFTHTLQFIDNNTFVIHVIIYYENDLGQHYDTYYWLRGKLNDFGFSQTVDPQTRKPVFVIDENQFWRIVSFTDENNYSSVYTLEEGKGNLHHLKRIGELLNE